MKHLTEAEREISENLVAGDPCRQLLTTISDLRHEMNMQSSAMIELKQLREKCEGLEKNVAAFGDIYQREKLISYYAMDKELTKLRARNERLTAALEEIAQETKTPYARIAKEALAGEGAE